MNDSIISIPIEHILPHPAQEKHFPGRVPDDKFRASVMQHGVQETCIVTPIGERELTAETIAILTMRGLNPKKQKLWFMISGHQRQICAGERGDTTLRCEPRTYANPGEEETMLLVFNVDTELTPKQKRNMYEHLLGMSTEQLESTLKSAKKGKKDQEVTDSPAIAGKASKRSRKTQAIAAVSGVNEAQVERELMLLDGEKWEKLYSEMRSLGADETAIERARTERAEMIEAYDKGSLSATSIGEEVVRRQRAFREACPKFKKKGKAETAKKGTKTRAKEPAALAITEPLFRSGKPDEYFQEETYVDTEAGEIAVGWVQIAEGEAVPAVVIENEVRVFPWTYLVQHARSIVQAS